MSVRAVLNEATDTTVTSSSTASVTPSPAPDALIGSPTCITFGIITDLADSKMQYSYHVFQTYSTAGGVTGIAQTTGTSDWIAIPGVSHDFPNVSVTPAVTSAILSGSVQFSINSSIGYTKTTPAIYTVQTI